MPLHRRRCRSCDHEFPVISHRRWDPKARATTPWHYFTEDHPVWDEEGLTDEQKNALAEGGHLYECPKCFSSDLASIVAVGIGIRLGGEAGVGREYPYFDRTLGMHIKSAQHHRRVQKRMGIRQVDNAMEHVIDEHGRIESENDRHEAAYQEMLRQQADDPEIRQAQDLLARVREDAGPDPVEQVKAQQTFMKRSL